MAGQPKREDYGRSPTQRLCCAISYAVCVFLLASIGFASALPRPLDSQPEVQYVEVGSAVTLECPSSAAPSVPMRWTFTGEDGNSMTVGTVEQVCKPCQWFDWGCKPCQVIIKMAEQARFNISETNHTLTLLDVAHEDAGSYSCLLGNDTIGLVKVGEIKLGVLTPMNFVQRPKNVRMEAGGQGAMDCEAEGDPKPRIVWRVDAKPLPRGGMWTVENEGRRLLFSNIQKSATITCLAISNQAQLHHNVRIFVARPARLSDPNKVVVFSGETAILKCPTATKRDFFNMWIKDRAVWYIGWDRTPRITLDSSTYSLKIREVSVADKGDYTCAYTRVVGGIPEMIKEIINLRVIEKFEPQQGSCDQREIQCLDDQCISERDFCDGQKDCTLGEDENLEMCQDPTYFYDQNDCVSQNNTNVPKFFKCDHIVDCKSGKDETNCDYVCSEPEKKCHSGECYSASLHCDGVNDCLDGSDEGEVAACAYKCPLNEFSCGFGICIPSEKVCDTMIDCESRLDETNCTVSCDLVCDENKKCVTNIHVCDKIPDCDDGADESDCHYTCLPSQFQCGSDDSCIPKDYICDGMNDCADGSDEAQCEEPHTCLNGYQIPNHQKCDDFYDCKFGDDETGCGVSVDFGSVSCENSQDFFCPSHNGAGPKCISSDKRCNKQIDCLTGDDEKDCGHRCSDDAFLCPSGQCISKMLVCDGANDCGILGGDEKNCIESCPEQSFRCHSGKCIMIKQKCDGVLDCSDGEDETTCTTPVPIFVPQIEMPREIEMPLVCSLGEFTCVQSKKCILMVKRCDGVAGDCLFNEDEDNCPVEICHSIEFKCNDGTCVPKSYVCDGFNDCSNGEDENQCDAEQCDAETEFTCPAIKNAHQFCISLDAICDGYKDCGHVGEVADENEAICVADHVSDIKALRVSENNIVLSWKKPATGSVDHYIISIHSKEALVYKEKYTALHDESARLQNVTVLRLAPGAKYRYTISTGFRAFQAREEHGAKFIQRQMPSTPYRVDIRALPPMNREQNQYGIIKPSIKVYVEKPLGIVHGYQLQLSSVVDSEISVVAKKIVTIAELVFFENLQPGTRYTLTVQSSVGMNEENVQAPILSKTFSVNYTTIPLPAKDITLVSRTPTELKLKIKGPEYGDFTDYKIEYLQDVDDDDDDDEVEHTYPSKAFILHKPDLKSNYMTTTISNLSPAKSYNIKVSTLSSNITHPPYQRVSRTFWTSLPQGRCDARILRPTYITVSSLTLLIKLNSVPVDYYTINISSSRTGKHLSFTMFQESVTETQVFKVPHDFPAGDTLKIDLIAEFTGENYTCSAENEALYGTLPPVPYDLEIQKQHVNTTSMKISWKYSESLSSITSFMISYHPESASENTKTIVIRDGNVRERMIENLKPAVIYQFMIAAVSEETKLEGLHGELKHGTAPESPLDPRINQLTSYHIEIGWTKPKSSVDTYIIEVYGQEGSKLFSEETADLNINVRNLYPGWKFKAEISSKFHGVLGNKVVKVFDLSIICNADAFRCPLLNRYQPVFCVPNEQMCNGWNDCQNDERSDEADCKAPTPLPPKVSPEGEIIQRKARGKVNITLDNDFSEIADDREAFIKALKELLSRQLGVPVYSLKGFTLEEGSIKIHFIIEANSTSETSGKVDNLRKLMKSGKLNIETKQGVPAKFLEITSEKLEPIDELVSIKGIEQDPSRISNSQTEVGVTWDLPANSQQVTAVRLLYQPFKVIFSDLSKDFSTLELNDVIHIIDAQVSHHTQTELVPGMQYLVKIFPMREEEVGPVAVIKVQTSPLPVSDLQVISKTHDTLSISWTSPDPSTSLSEKTLIQVIEYDVASYIVQEVEVELNHHEFVGLTPGTMYQISLMNEVLEKHSQSTQIIVPTSPLPPTDLQVTLRTEGTDSKEMMISLTWKAPLGNHERYMGEIYPTTTMNENTIFEFIVPDSEIEKGVMFPVVEKGREHTIKIWTVSNAVPSEKLIMKINTHPANPMLDINYAAENRLGLQWSLEDNSFAISYVLDVYTVGPIKSENKNSYTEDNWKQTTYSDIVDMNAVVEQLPAGYLHHLHLIAIGENNASSPIVKRSVYTMPNPVKELKATRISNTLDKVQLEWKKPSDDIMEKLRIDPNTVNFNEEIWDKKMEKTFTYLINWGEFEGEDEEEGSIETKELHSLIEYDFKPGHEYVFVVTARLDQVDTSQLVISQERYEDFVATPLPVENFIIHNETSSSCKLQWEKPAKGQVSFYEIAVTSENGKQENHESFETVFELKNLDYGCHYDVSVVAVAHDVAKSEIISGKTSLLPEKVSPKAIVVSNLTRSSVFITWVKPEGRVDGYIVNLIKNGVKTHTKEVNSTTVFFEILVPGSKYTIEIESVSYKKVAAKSESSFHTKALIGETCDKDNACIDLNTYCNMNTKICSCSVGYVNSKGEDRKDVFGQLCIRSGSIGTYCKDTSQCSDIHSVCTQPYSKCVCGDGYIMYTCPRESASFCTQDFEQKLPGKNQSLVESKVSKNAFSSAVCELYHAQSKVNNKNKEFSSATTALTRAEDKLKGAESVYNSYMFKFESAKDKVDFLRTNQTEGIKVLREVERDLARKTVAYENAVQWLHRASLEIAKQGRTYNITVQALEKVKLECKTCPWYAFWCQACQALVEMAQQAVDTNRWPLVASQKVLAAAKEVVERNRWPLDLAKKSFSSANQMLNQSKWIMGSARKSLNAAKDLVSRQKFPLQMARESVTTSKHIVTESQRSLTASQDLLAASKSMVQGFRSFINDGRLIRTKRSVGERLQLSHVIAAPINDTKPGCQSVAELSHLYDTGTKVLALVLKSLESSSEGDHQSLATSISSITTKTLLTASFHDCASEELRTCLLNTLRSLSNSAVPSRSLDVQLSANDVAAVSEHLDKIAIEKYEKEFEKVKLLLWSWGKELC